MADRVLVSRRGPVGVLTLNRPAERNPLDREMAAELLAGLYALFEDAGTRSLAITGSGTAFCAGGDLAQMATISKMRVEDAYAWPEYIVSLHKTMLSAPKPVIAAVNGPSYAGGMGLAGMCDVILATSDARFALPEASVGLFPMIIVAHLARALPRKRLLEMMLTGEPMGADEAHRLGFVSRVCAGPSALMNAVDEYGAKFLRTSPASVSMGRRAFTLLADMPAAQALDAAQFLNLPFFYGDDFQEGAAAFLGKRLPRWADHHADHQAAEE